MYRGSESRHTIERSISKFEYYLLSCKITGKQGSRVWIREGDHVGENREVLY